MESKQSNRLLSVQVNMIPMVHVSTDKMQALLTLYPPLSDKPALQQEGLETILREEGINFGIDQAILTENVKKLATLKSPLNSIPIARGMLPIDGKDAYLRLELEIGPIPGKILRDGTIDFRERKIFTGVDENQVIAVRVPETIGTPGINVFGESIPQQPGKDITVKSPVTATSSAARKAKWLAACFAAPAILLEVMWAPTRPDLPALLPGLMANVTVSIKISGNRSWT